MKPEIIIVQDIDTDTEIGKLLIAAIGKLMNMYKDLSPNEILDILQGAVRMMV